MGGDDRLGMGGGGPDSKRTILVFKKDMPLFLLKEKITNSKEKIVKIPNYRQPF